MRLFASAKILFLCLSVSVSVSTLPQSSRLRTHATDCVRARSLAQTERTFSFARPLSWILSQRSKLVFISKFAPPKKFARRNSSLAPLGRTSLQRRQTCGRVSERTNERTVHASGRQILTQAKCSGRATQTCALAEINLALCFALRWQTKPNQNKPKQ